MSHLVMNKALNGMRLKNVSIYLLNRMVKIAGR